MVVRLQDEAGVWFQFGVLEYSQVIMSVRYDKGQGDFPEGFYVESVNGVRYHGYMLEA